MTELVERGRPIREYVSNVDIPASMEHIDGIFSGIQTSPVQSSLTISAGTLTTHRPNPSFKRTRSGKPALAFISFSAKAVSPARAA